MDYQTLVVAGRELMKALEEGEDLTMIQHHLITMLKIRGDLVLQQGEEAIAEVTRRSGVVGEDC